MTLLREIGLLWKRKLVETLRQPTWVFVGLSTPLIYLALFAPLLKSLADGPAFRRGSVLDVFMPGILVLMAFGAGMGAGWGIIWELDSGVIERLRVTPASRFALLMGTVLRDVVMFVVPAIVVVLVAMPFGFHPQWIGMPLLLALLCLLTVITSACSNALGIVLRQIGSLAAIVTGLQLPLTLLAGILLPLSLAPVWIVIAAHFNPLYYAVQASRTLSAGTIASSPVLEGYIVITFLVLATLWWATRTYKRAIG